MQNTANVDTRFSVWLLLGQTADAMARVRERELRQHRISLSQSAILLIAEAIGDKATPAEIARRLLRKPASVTGIINRMAQSGLVMKVKDLPKKNFIRVVLTEKGRKLYNYSLKRMAVEHVMSSLSEDELQQLRSYLETLRTAALKELGWKPRGTLAQLV